MVPHAGPFHSYPFPLRPASVIHTRSRPLPHKHAHSSASLVSPPCRLHQNHYRRHASRSHWPPMRLALHLQNCSCKAAHAISPPRRHHTPHHHLTCSLFPIFASSATNQLRATIGGGIRTAKASYWDSFHLLHPDKLKDCMTCFSTKNLRIKTGADACRANVRSAKINSPYLLERYLYRYLLYVPAL